MSLGCATHSYTVTDRDGGQVASSGTLTAVSWNRVLNDVSSATVVVGVSGPSCCAELGSVRSWRHRLNVYRLTAFGSSLVWSGPVVNVDWKNDEVVISAVDLIGLLDRRVPHQDFDFEATDLTGIARALIDDGFAPDDPGHTVTVVGPCGVTGGRAYRRDVGQTADHLRDLADTGLDFTAVGTDIVILPDAFCDVVGLLSDDDLPDGLSVAEDGASLVTRAIVAGPEADDPVGTAGGANDYYGLLERYIEQRNITDQTSADQAAAGALTASLAVPVFIDTQDITLSPQADVEIERLVPGWCLDVTSAATCRTITQRLKITGVQVSEDGGTEAEPGHEKVTIQVAAHGDELAVS
jgi:hypothetical protein